MKPRTNALDRHVGYVTNPPSRISRTMLMAVTWRSRSTWSRMGHSKTTTEIPKTTYAYVSPFCCTWNADVLHVVNVENIEIQEQSDHSSIPSPSDTSVDT